MDVYSARLLGKAATARQEKFLGPAWCSLAIRRKGDQEKRWSHRQHTIQTKPFGEEKVGTGHVDTKKNISARCKRFVRNTRMDFGALKAVLFLHSMGISWEQKAAFMWRTHHFRAHILASEPPEFCEAEGQNSDELAGIHIHREETKWVLGSPLKKYNVLFFFPQEWRWNLVSCVWLNALMVGLEHWGRIYRKYLLLIWSEEETRVSAWHSKVALLST